MLNIDDNDDERENKMEGWIVYLGNANFFIDICIFVNKNTMFYLC